MDYMEKCSVAELIVLCRTPSDAAFAELVKRYTPLMQSISRSYFDNPMELDEAFAEACVVLHRAAMSYNLEQTEVTFGLYAQICIRNKMLDMLRMRDSADRLSEVDIETLGVSGGIDSALIMRETVNSYKKRAKELLSDYEYKVFLLVLKGSKTAEIAEFLGTSAKSVDNAKSRMWRVLRSAFPEGLDV